MKHNQDGALNVLLLPLLFAVIFLLGAGGFAAWAYTSRQDYKLNSDQKVDAAVTVAKKLEGVAKDKQFQEAEKTPFRTYTGPDAFGSLTVFYPKTWSGYVKEATNDSTPIDGYFYPAIVPSLADPASTFALRLLVVNRAYSDVVRDFQSRLSQGKVKISPYQLPKVPDVIGVRIEGQVTDLKTGSMIILPLRDKTMQVWTEGNGFGSDYNNIILTNLVFSP